MHLRLLLIQSLLLLIIQLDSFGVHLQVALLLGLKSFQKILQLRYLVPPTVLVCRYLVDGGVDSLFVVLEGFYQFFDIFGNLEVQRQVIIKVERVLQEHLAELLTHQFIIFNFVLQFLL